MPMEDTYIKQKVVGIYMKIYRFPKMCIENSLLKLECAKSTINLLVQHSVGQYYHEKTIAKTTAATVSQDHSHTTVANTTHQYTLYTKNNTQCQ